MICFVGWTRQPYAIGTKKDAINEQFFNRTQNDVVWGLIALFLTNQNAGNTIDFKMNVINPVISFKNHTATSSKGKAEIFNTYFCFAFRPAKSTDITPFFVDLGLIISISEEEVVFELPSTNLNLLDLTIFLVTF